MCVCARARARVCLIVWRVHAAAAVGRQSALRQCKPVPRALFPARLPPGEAHSRSMAGPVRSRGFRRGLLWAAAGARATVVLLDAPLHPARESRSVIARTTAAVCTNRRVDSDAQVHVYCGGS